MAVSPYKRAVVASIFAWGFFMIGAFAGWTLKGDPAPLVLAEAQPEPSRCEAPYCTVLQTVQPLPETLISARP